MIIIYSAVAQIHISSNTSLAATFTLSISGAPAGVVVTTPLTITSGVTGYFYLRAIIQTKNILNTLNLQIVVSTVTGTGSISNKTYLAVNEL